MQFDSLFFSEKNSWQDFCKSKILIEERKLSKYKRKKRNLILVSLYFLMDLFLSVINQRRA